MGCRNAYGCLMIMDEYMTTRDVLISTEMVLWHTQLCPMIRRRFECRVRHVIGPFKSSIHHAYVTLRPGREAVRSGPWPTESRYPRA